MSRICIALCLLLLNPAAAFAHSAQSGDIAIGHIWSYPTGANVSGAGYGQAPQSGERVADIYGPLLNGGGAADAVTSVTSPAGTRADIVTWVRGNQFTRDFPLPLPPGKPLALGPGTEFIRIYGVSGTYKSGDRFPITFHFQHAPAATIDVVVQGK